MIRLTMSPSASAKTVLDDVSYEIAKGEVFASDPPGTEERQAHDRLLTPTSGDVCEDASAVGA